MARKFMAVNELYHWMVGSIDTREKFLDKRIELAKSVWATMESNDSLECRGCHEFDSMLIERQSMGARRSHQRGVEHGMTCIDCHKGISHQLPSAFWEKEHALMKETGRQCGDCHAGMTINEDIRW